MAYQILLQTWPRSCCVYEMVAATAWNCRFAVKHYNVTFIFHAISTAFCAQCKRTEFVSCLDGHVCSYYNLWAQKPVSNVSWVTILSFCLSRVLALQLLQTVVSQCTMETFVQHWEYWAKSVLQIIKVWWIFILILGKFTVQVDIGERIIIMSILCLSIKLRNISHKGYILHFVTFSLMYD